MAARHLLGAFCEHAPRLALQGTQRKEHERRKYPSSEVSEGAPGLQVFLRLLITSPMSLPTPSGVLIKRSSVDILLSSLGLIM